jgi:hypothetical protein
MDPNTGTGATPSSGMTQAQAENLSRIGLPTDIINEIYYAKLPDNVLSKLETVNSPQQLIDEVGTLWLSNDLVERIRRLQPSARVEQPPMGAQPTQPMQQAAPPYNYGQPTQPAPTNYGQAPQQGAPPPGYQQYPQQQQQYPPQGYQQPYPVAPTPAKKGGVPAIVWILGSIALVIVLCVVGVMVMLNALGNGLVGAVNTAGALVTATEFSTAMSTGSYDTAHDLLSGDLASRYSEATLQSKWEALVGADNTFTVNSDFGTPRTDGNRTVVPWTIEGQNGKTYKVDLYFSQISGSSNDSVLQIVDAKPDLIPAP